MSARVSALRRDSSCRRDLLWRCDVDEPIALGPLTSAMKRYQYEPVKGPAVLAQWRHRDRDHVILYVPATGRVQVRLGGFTPHDVRVAAARMVFASFRASVASAQASEAA